MSYITAQNGYPLAMTSPDTVVIFAPIPVLTVTVEDRSGEDDIHVHAGGQGVWQSRMVASLGVPTVLCSALGGETGSVLGHLLPNTDVTLLSSRQSHAGHLGAAVHPQPGDGARSRRTT